MRIRDALDHAQAQGLPRLDAQWLLLHAIGRGAAERAWLIAHDADPLPGAAGAAYDALCRRRLAGEPLAYLVGTREFFGLTLRVDARVLVPRPETETLVEWALEALRPVGQPRVLDLGTGSGALVLAIGHARPDARLHASDASTAALEVAQANAQALGLDVCWARGDWFDALATADAPRMPDGPNVLNQARFDLIVSNPPYIAEGDPHLAALRHEPVQALTSGADGLAALRAIIARAPAHLYGGGWLLLEHGHDQADAVRALLARRGFADVDSRDDLTGIARCSGGRWPQVE